MPSLSSVFGGSGTSNNSKSNEGLKQTIQDAVRQEYSITNANELVNKITENCFQNCISVPEKQLSSSDNYCIQNCMVKYMNAWNLISKSYVARIQQENTSS